MRYTNWRKCENSVFKICRIWENRPLKTWRIWENLLDKICRIWENLYKTVEITRKTALGNT